MPAPLPFRKAFALFFRQMSPHVPMDETALRAAGIGPWPALICMSVGWTVSCTLTVGATWIFLQAISSNLWLIALILFTPLLLLVQGAVTVWVYWLWIRFRPLGA